MFDTTSRSSSSLLPVRLQFGFLLFVSPAKLIKIHSERETQFHTFSKSDALKRIGLGDGGTITLDGLLLSIVCVCLLLGITIVAGAKLEFDSKCGAMCFRKWGVGGLLKHYATSWSARWHSVTHSRARSPRYWRKWKMKMQFADSLHFEMTEKNPTNVQSTIYRMTFNCGIVYVWLGLMRQREKLQRNSNEKIQLNFIVRKNISQAQRQHFDAEWILDGNTGCNWQWKILNGSLFIVLPNECVHVHASWMRNDLCSDGIANLEQMNFVGISIFSI